MARLVDHGAAIHVAFLADGVTARADAKHGPARSTSELASRRTAAQEACAILGVRSISFDEFPDNRMDTVALLEIVKVIEALIARYTPDTVFTHHAGDVNIDHRRIHDAATAACRPQPGHPVRCLASFEVTSSTEWQLPAAYPPFVPNWFVDISATLERKIAALEAYRAEVRNWPHPRSRRGVEYLARWRGCTVGVDAAEAFVLGRQIS
jgi:LmbE family N-acetylglucosaminyl deacetylase